MPNANFFFLLLFSLLAFKGSSQTGNGVYRIPYYETDYSVIEVDVRINGFPRRFIFDTGSSTISFGQDFYQILKSNNYLSEDDLLGKTKTKLADGNLADAQYVKIDKISIGNLELFDIEALMILKPNVPFLLGQQIFKTFEDITINNSRKEIVLRTGFAIEELRIIPCQQSVVKKITPIKDLLHNSSIKIQAFSQETNIPPPRKAIERLPNSVVIRYFSDTDQATAQELKKELGFSYPASKISIENMSKYYNQSIPKYLELWLNEI